MNEKEAVKAIASGNIVIDGVKYRIVKEPHGWCDKCYFYENAVNCPAIAQHICCSGGFILKMDELLAKD